MAKVRSIKTPVKPKKELPENTILKKDLVKAYVAFGCDTWRTSIKNLLQDSFDKLDNDEIILPDGIVNLFNAEATVEQKAFVKRLGISLRSDKNAFICSDADEDVRTLSRKLFGESSTFQLSAGATPSNRPDLKGRAFFVHPHVKVILHAAKGDDNATIIELVKR